MSFLHSLRFKITLGVVVPVIVIMAVFSFVKYSRHRDALMDNLVMAAASASEVIEHSLQHAMLTQDFAEIQQIMEGIATHEGITDVFLLSRVGEIRIAPRSEMVGVRLDQSDPTCQICHRFKPENRKRSAVLTTASGERVFRNMNPIDNRPPCYGCHPAENRINGVLITDFSMAEISLYLARYRRESFLISVAGIVAIILTVNVIMSRMVITRLERFLQTIQLLGRGDLDQRAAVDSKDEIGELSASFNRMADGLQEKERENIRLYEEIQQKEALRGHLLKKLINAQEEERRRIARELHDEFAQTLTAFVMSMEAAEQAAGPAIGSAAEMLRRTRALASQTLEQTRRLILDLHPIALDDLGLIPAIRWYAERHLEVHGVTVQVKADGLKHRLPPEIEVPLFRIVQESISNIARHAQARHVVIALTLRDGLVAMSVQDDGQGFDPAAAKASAGKIEGLGILGMQERATLMGGRFEIVSQPERGTRLSVEVPLARSGCAQDGAGSVGDRPERLPGENENMGEE